MQLSAETYYPLKFRQEDSIKLANAIARMHSLEIIGMKRVGISNFLRYFIHHPKLITNLKLDPRVVFIEVDLNDLIERELFPFWRLLLKRIIDKSNELPISSELKDKLNHIFIKAIQFNDLLFTIDSVKETIKSIITAGYKPVIFLIRFDRLIDTLNSEFLANLQSIVELTAENLMFVITSARSLIERVPAVFKNNDFTIFSHPIYLKPALTDDSIIILQSFAKRYQINLTVDLQKVIIELAGGHVHYLQLSLIVIKEAIIENPLIAEFELITKIKTDERINLQSEELLTDLSSTEIELLKQILSGKKVKEIELMANRHILNTGIVVNNDAGELTIFSKILTEFIKKEKPRRHNSSNIQNILTKKENSLYNLLVQKQNQTCEREDIISVVWPEVKDLGVSDWAIDRLVFRLRAKLKQTGEYRVKTIRTRGFCLVSR